MDSNCKAGLYQLLEETLIKDNKLQCKDIPTLPILEYVRDYGGIGCTWYELKSLIWCRTVRTAMPRGLSDKLVLAKMRNLVDKGLLNGCGCGCRGDFELTPKGATRILELKGRAGC